MVVYLSVGQIPTSCGRGLTLERATSRDHALRQFRRAAFEVVVTSQNTIAQALERSRELLSYLVDHREELEPNSAGAKQLQNMAVHVTSIEEWLASAPADPSNAVKRLRDFSNTIERLKVPGDSAPTTRSACQELVESLRFAADQLDLRRVDTTSGDSGGNDPRARVE